MPTRKSSSVAGSSASTNVSSKEVECRQQASTSEAASDDLMDLQALISESVNHPQGTSANGQQAGTPSGSAAVSVASAGTAPLASDPEAGGHLGASGIGMYAEPGAVQAWASRGAASSQLDQEAFGPHHHAAQHPAGMSQQPGIRHMNGYNTNEASQSRLSSLHDYGRHSDNQGGTSSGQHWQAAASQRSHALSVGSSPHGSGRAAPQYFPGPRESSATPSAPSYALSAYAKHPQGHQGNMQQQQQQQQQQFPAYSGRTQRRQASAGPGAEVTSSLQSLDLAHDSWQARRHAHNQHLLGQRWGRSGRPTGYEGGSATQPSSARVSPERSRDGQDSVASASHRPLYPSAFHSANPDHSVPAGAYTDQRPGLPFNAALQRKYNAFHGTTGARLPHEAAEAAVLGQGSQQRPVQADWQRPAPVQSRDLAAATDIERLLQQLTPQMQVRGQSIAGLTLVCIACGCHMCALRRLLKHCFFAFCCHTGCIHHLTACLAPGRQTACLHVLQKVCRHVLQSVQISSLMLCTKSAGKSRNLFKSAVSVC